VVGKPSVISERVRVVFVSLTNDVGSERVVAEMGRCGVECALISPKGFYCATLVEVIRHFTLPAHYGVRFGTLFVRGRLEQAAREWQPDLVLPLDDLSSWLLRCLAVDQKTNPQLQDLLIKSLGQSSGYSAAISRREFMDKAQALGLDKPLHCEPTNLNAALAAARQWGYPVVVKTEHTSGGVGVTIVRNPSELAERLSSNEADGWLQKIRQPIKRWVYRRAGFREEATARTMIQSFVPGVPAFRTVAAWQGRVLQGASFVAEQVNPKPTGASTVVRHVENVSMDHAVVQMVAALKCSGFVSFDFVLDPKSGRASLIEMNPRSIGTTHLGRLFGSDICGALAAILGGDRVLSVTAQFTTELVALFPKEMERNSNSPYLKSTTVYHDVPIDNPRLLNIYLRRIRKLNPRIDEGLLALLRDDLHGVKMHPIASLACQPSES